jgi:hypothetical protein
VSSPPSAQPAQAPAPQQPADAPTQVEQVQMQIPPTANVADAAASPGTASPGTASPSTGTLTGARPATAQPGAKPGFAKPPAPRAPGMRPPVSDAWQPSGEAPVWIHEPPTQIDPQAVGEPIQPEPKKPDVIEVPGTASNPFADDNEPAKPDDSTKYRAGKPSEEEF